MAIFYAHEYGACGHTWHVCANAWHLCHTVDDADSNDTAIVPCEDAFAVPCAQPPHTDATIVRTADQAVTVTCKSKDLAPSSEHIK